MHGVYHSNMTTPHSLFLPAEFQWSPPGLAASRRRFLMLTPLWEVDSPADVPELSAAAAGVEERMGRRGVVRNGISFPSAEVRKVDSLSDDLRGRNNRKVSNITFLC